MQKLMKNWIFTLITCILLAILSVLMFLDGAGVGDLFIGRRIIHVLTAVALAIYVVLALCPMVPKYHNGTGRIFLLCEIAILAFTVVTQIGVEMFSNIPWLSDLAVCSVLGLALWLRAFVLIVHSYLVLGIVSGGGQEKAEGEEKKTAPAFVRTPLWKLCGYVLMSSVGVWQMARPLIEDRFFVFCIAAAAGVFAVIFGVFTAQNHKARPKKEKKQPETVAEAATEIVAALPDGEVPPTLGESEPKEKAE